MDANELRNKLFETLFTSDDSILLSDLMNNLNEIFIKPWTDLRELLNNNMLSEGFYINGIESFKHINKYLIVKFRFGKYLIVDIRNKKVLNEEEVSVLFNEDFFEENFNEKYTGEEDYLYYYEFFGFKGDVTELINLYIQNDYVYDCPNIIFYENIIDNAKVYLSINFTNCQIQIGFRTKDQFLYETLFMNTDLTPYSLQDAQNKIGIDKMNEMFNKVKDIKVPLNNIPSEITSFLNEYNEIEKRYVK